LSSRVYSAKNTVGLIAKKVSRLLTLSYLETCGISLMDFEARDRQLVRNRDSRERWSNYTSHRERILNILTANTPANGRLLLLGAGNCNDLDLSALLRHYSELHLVDLDSEAMLLGVQRQGMATDSRLSLFGDVDVTGVANWCCRWNPNDLPGRGEYAEALQRARDHRWSQLRPPYDVTASIGLLSQLVETVLLALGERSPAAWELVAAVRLRHVQLLLESVRPGGQVVLGTEVVSSTTCPELLRADSENLGTVLARAIQARNFFTGLNPVMIEALFRESPQLTGQVQAIERIEPWLWDFGPRIYACTAVRAIRRCQ
jgi:hypothetical protein